MPTINQENMKKTFKAKSYRAWNLSETLAKSPLEDGKEDVLLTQLVEIEPVKELSSTEQAALHPTSAGILQNINPALIVNWEYSDRPPTELGDIGALAKEFKDIGQQQPCVVRPHPTLLDKYELIIGERRWRAAIMANMDLLAIIKHMTDEEAAFAQAVENENRENLSDYAKGMSYSKLIEKGIIKQKDLIEKLGKSKQYISALLSFSKIPPSIIEAIGDMSHVSASTAESLKQIANRGQAYIDALILISNKIRANRIGGKTLLTQVESIVLKKNQSEKINKKIVTKDGRHIFTWRDDNNHLPSIHFPKQIGDFLLSGEIDIDILGNELLSILEDKLKIIKEKSG